MMKRKTVLGFLPLISMAIVLGAGVGVAQPTKSGSGSGHSSSSSKGHPQKTMQHASPASSTKKQAVSHQKASGTSAPSSATKPQNVSSDALSQTRPDVSTYSGKEVRPLNGPLSAISDGGRMLLYLFPILLLIVGGAALLRKFPQVGFRRVEALQWLQKWPTMSSFTKMMGTALFTGHPPLPRQLRVVETLSLGNTALHLVEVQNKLLLLGAAPTGITLLREYSAEEAAAIASPFRALVEAADARHDHPGVPLVEELDDRLQEASSILARSANRLRTVREVEADIE